MFSPSYNCLLGKYKPFGKKNCFLAWRRKKLYCSVLQIRFLNKNSNENYQQVSNHEKWENKLASKCCKDSKTVLKMEIWPMVHDLGDLCNYVNACTP